MIVRFIHGFSFGINITLALSIISLIAGKGFRGRSISLYAVLIALGLMIGPALGSFIIKYTSMETIFYFLLFLGLPPIITSIYLIRNSTEIKREYHLDF